MGVLRRKVPEWLKDEPLKSHILAISQASPKDGGGGAFMCVYVVKEASHDALGLLMREYRAKKQQTLASQAQFLGVSPAYLSA